MIATPDQRGRQPETAEVVIVGAGPAGLSAAAELRRLGAGRVVVIERELDPGGIPRHSDHPGFGVRDLRRNLTGPEYVRTLVERAVGAGAEIRTGTQATGWGEGLTLELTARGGRTSIAAPAVVLATGCRERPRSARMIAGSRTEGVMTTGTLQQLVHLQRTPMSGRAVIVGAEHVSYSALETLHHAGARPIAMVTEHARHQTFGAFALGGAIRYRAPLRTRTAVREIHGRSRVEGVTVADLETGATAVIDCELVVLTADWSPDQELAAAAGARLDPRTRGPIVDCAHHTSVTGLFAAGNVLHGAEPADVCALSGIGVATAVAAHLAGFAWPAFAVPVLCPAPLDWFVPGLLAPARPVLMPLRVRAREILRDVQIEVRQGERVLHRDHVGHVMPGRSTRLASSWIAAVDSAGPEVTVRVVSARRQPVRRRSSWIARQLSRL